MTSKIKIKMGPIEVEYEGSEDFLKKELSELLAAVSKLHQESGGNFGVAEKRPASGNGQRSGKPIEGTTSTIAARLGCKSGPDLLIAAAAQLTFVENKPEFSRKDLNEAQKLATNWYNENHTKNLSQNLGVLVRDQEFLEIRPGMYALQAKKKAALETRLADA